MALPPSSSPSTHSQVVTDLNDVYGLARGGVGDVNHAWPHTGTGVGVRVGGAASTFDNARLGAVPVSLIRACTVTSVAFSCATAVAGAVARVGIYSCGSDGHPGSLLADCGTFDASTTGTKTVTLGTPLALSLPQIIFVGVMADSTATGNPILHGTNRSTVGNGVGPAATRGSSGDATDRRGGHSYNAAVAGTLTASPTWSFGVNGASYANFNLTFSAVTN